MSIAKSKTRYAAKPFLKWAGGKNGLTPQLLTYAPKKFNNYFEPFVGGGAVFFSLDVTGKSYINDINSVLMNTYLQIRDNIDYVIEQLCNIGDIYKKLDNEKKKDFYYEKRKEYNETEDDLKKTILFLFLNKTCFNGLYRENKQGNFNVPYGQYKNPTICDRPNLKNVAAKLQKTYILNMSYAESLRDAKADDFIYFDPPYFPLNATSKFTSYNKDDFDANDQRKLAETFHDLDKKGCKVLLSNSDTEFIKELYKDYKQETVLAGRSINANGSGRKKINELLIFNY